ncbi:MAG: capsule assembly Wzi family protein [Nitrospirae bacterium]|nr:capsule assembly Wzi family protein [Nitrospirota bacterium]
MINPAGVKPIPTLTLPLKGRENNLAPSPLAGEGQGEGALYLYFLIVLFFITLSFYNLSTSHAAMSSHIPLHSSLEEDIQTLQSMGYLDEIFSGARPYSRMVVAKAIVRINFFPSPLRGEGQGEGAYPQVVTILLNRIEQELKEEIEFLQGARPPLVELNQIKLQSVILDGKFSNGGLNRLQSIKNNNGRDYENGLNFYGDISLQARLGDSTLLYLDPEFQYTERDTPGTDELYRLRLREGYFKYHTHYSDIMFGNVPLWWGQGYNGSLVLTDNIEPLTMIRFYKEAPFEFTLPLPLSLSPASVPLPLGESVRVRGLMRFSYDFFVSRLEHDRELPGPVFWGLRIGFKPIPSWEIGMARTAMFGGGKRPVTLKTITNSITGIGENTPKEAGNQIGGFDTNFRGHIRQQPFNIYAELYGEDEAGSLPSKYAYLAGLYLPDIAGLSGNTLRVEYADSNLRAKKEPRIWYTHHVYTDGYTYKGRIMGHGMGTDANDFIIKWEKYLTADMKGFLSYERNRAGRFDGIPVIWREANDYSAGADIKLKQGIELSLNYTYQKVDNFDFSSDKDFQNNEVWVNISFE